MKKFLIPKRIIEIILIIAAIIASIYVFTIIIDGSIDIANYDPSVEGSQDPALGLVFAGILVFAVGIYYAGIYTIVGIIPIILTIANNFTVKKTGEGKHAKLWWPILLELWTPSLVVVLLLFLRLLNVVS